MGHIDNGKLVFDSVDCPECHGAGKRSYNFPCERHGQAQRGKACPHCGAKSKDHRWHQGSLETCRRCEGQGKVKEGPCSYSTFNPFDVIPVEVVRVNRQANWNESCLGMGCLWSCVDYGRTKDLSDADLIAEVKSCKSAQHSQYCKFARDDGTVAKALVIILRSDGYSVKAKF